MGGQFVQPPPPPHTHTKGEFLSGTFALAFQDCVHSSWRIGTAVPSLVNKKVSNQQDKHTVLLWRASCGACTVAWRLILSPQHGDVIHAETKECIKGPFPWVYGPDLHHFHVNMLHSSLRKWKALTKIILKLLSKETIYIYLRISS